MVLGVALRPWECMLWFPWYLVSTFNCCYDLAYFIYVRSLFIATIIESLDTAQSSQYISRRHISQLRVNIKGWIVAVLLEFSSLDTLEFIESTSNNIDSFRSSLVGHG